MLKPNATHHKQVPPGLPLDVPPSMQGLAQFSHDFRFTFQNQVVLGINIVFRLAWHRIFATDRRLLINRGHSAVGRPTQRQKLNVALHDAKYSLLLYGYHQVSGLELNRSTGSFLCLLRNLISQVDEVFEEQCKQGQYLKLLDALKHPLVELEDERITDFLLANSRALEVTNSLREAFDQHIVAYARVAAMDLTRLSWEQCVELVGTDSCLQLPALMEMVRLFNDHPKNDNIRVQFHALGIAGKIADDLINLRRDLSNQHPNLVYAASDDFPVERERILRAVASSEDMVRDWWLRNAPRTFQRCLRTLHGHYNHIQAPALQLACRLMWLPTVWPLTYDKLRLYS